MAEFKQMPKMMTNEPTVILKLKKGGHVASEHKDSEGHTNMKGKSFMSARAEEAAEEGSSPKKPSMSDRRKAMSGALMSKKGGKVAKKALGGPMGAPPVGAAPAAPMDPRKAALLRAMMAKRGAMGAPAAPAAAPAGGLPTMKKGGKASTASMAKTTVTGNAGKFAKTKVVDGDKNAKITGTGGVRAGNAGGYKAGGTISGNESGFVKTKVVDGDKNAKITGTTGVRAGTAGGYAKGGGVEGNVDTTPKGVSNTMTGGVRAGNAGGFKKGGAAKKHFATGGSVNDAGKSVAMPKHPTSKPVSNTAQSGTFKKGGAVKKFAEGNRVEDASKGAYDATLRESDDRDMDIANTIRNAPSAAYSAVKRLLGIKPDAGAGRGSVNPPLARKSGGSAKR